MKFSARMMIRKDHVKKNKRCAVYIHFRINGKRGRIALDIDVDPNKWSQDRQSVKRTHPDADQINFRIRKALDRINTIVSEFRMREKRATPRMIREEFLDPTPKECFFEFAQKEASRRRGKINPATYRQSISALNKLRSFSGALQFNDLTIDLINEFDAWMTRELGNSQNTRMGTMKRIKVYTRLAKKKGLLKEDPFEDFKVSRIIGNRDYLNEQELNRMIRYFFSGEISDKHKRVLQYFLFSCFTSLRISDIKSISHRNIIDDNLVFQPRKTEKFGKRIRIPLGKSARQFISYKENSNEIFDQVISEQKTNKYLKEIARKLNIRKKVTFHVARHTFATMFIREGGDVTVLRHILGHSKIETTMIYLHMVEEEAKTVEQIQLLDRYVQDR